MASEPPPSTPFRLDIDGITFSHGAAAETVSPVFSLWLTFVLMYIGEQAFQFTTEEADRRLMGSMTLQQMQQDVIAKVDNSPVQIMSCSYVDKAALVCNLQQHI